MSILGDIFGANAQAQGYQQAAQYETQAIQQAIDLQKQMYTTTRADLGPYRVTGQSALDQLAQMYGLRYTNAAGQQVADGRGPNFSAFYQSPDYKFAMQQGLRGITGNAAATGGLDSGAIRKSEANFASGLATQNFNNYASRLSNLAGLGESSAAMTGQLGQQNANEQSQLFQNYGMAQGNAAINQGNIWGNLYSGLGGFFGGSGGGAFGSSYGSGLMSLASLFGG